MTGEKCPVGQEYLGAAMFQDEGNRFGVKPRINGVEHGAGHGDAEMSLEQGRNIGRHDRHRVPKPHAMRGECASLPAAALVEFRI